MPTARPWGALVATSLPLAALACSPAAAPTTPPPPTPPPTAPVASAPTPPPAPRLSGFTDLFASAPDAPPDERQAGRTSVATTRFGRGTFTHRTYHVWSHPDGTCPVARDEGCGSFSLRTGAPAPASDLWPSGGDDAGAGAQTERGPFAAPHEWVAFAGGRDAVYALRTGGKHIDRIDDQGKVTPFVSDDAMNGWNDLWVVERAGQIFVAGMSGPVGRYGRRAIVDGGLSGWKLAEVIRAGNEGARRLGPITELPMRPVSPMRLNAQGARTAGEGKMAVLGRPQLVALPDDGADKNRWAMVWLEVVAPPYSWPHNKPQKGVPGAPSAAPVAAAAEPAPKAAGKKGARHGCGGPASRRLDDKSVTKRAHVTRFAGARLLDDTVAWTGADVGDPLTLRLDARLDGDRVTVALPARARGGAASQTRWPGDDDEELKLTRDEQMTEIEFDPTAGEGMVVVQDHDRQLYRRFDARGQPVGEPAVFEQPGTIQDVARVGGKWMAVTFNPSRLFNLTDRTGPFDIPPALLEGGGSLELAGGKEGTLVQTDRHALRTATVSPAGVVGAPSSPEPLPESFAIEQHSLHWLQGSPIVAFLEERKDDGEADRIAWRALTPGSSWQRVEVPSRQPVRSYQVGFRRLHDDVVATIDRPGKQGYVWLKAGKSAFRDVPGEEETGEDGAPRGGPLLGGGLRLPPEPGPPVADEAAADAARHCQHSLATGPDTVVLACLHASDPQVPGLRVALRTLRVGGAR